jgi:hypothetical protein
MKRNHILLPALQFAAAAFFAQTALAQQTETYCVSKSDRRIVAASDCDDAANTDVLTIDAPAGLAVGSIIDEDDDMGSPASRVRARHADDLESGGFGEIVDRDDATSTTTSGRPRATGS